MYDQYNYSWICLDIVLTDANCYTCDFLKINITHRSICKVHLYEILYMTIQWNASVKYSAIWTVFFLTSQLSDYSCSFDIQLISHFALSPQRKHYLLFYWSKCFVNLSCNRIDNNKYKSLLILKKIYVRRNICRLM